MSMIIYAVFFSILFYYIMKDLYDHFIRSKQHIPQVTVCDESNKWALKRYLRRQCSKEQEKMREHYWRSQYDENERFDYDSDAEYHVSREIQFLLYKNAEERLSAYMKDLDGVNALADDEPVPEELYKKYQDILDK